VKSILGSVKSGKSHFLKSRTFEFSFLVEMKKLLEPKVTKISIHRLQNGQNGTFYDFKTRKLISRKI